MWIEIAYRPVSLFRLRPSYLTDPGFQSLLLPSYWTVRTAILAQAYHPGGTDAARRIFPLLQKVGVQISPPPLAVKSTVCWRGMNWKESGKRDKETGQVYENKGYGNKEYVSYCGELRIALEGEQSTLASIVPLATRINYFGKWGGFFQSLHVKEIEEPDRYYSEAMDKATGPGIPQQLDEWGENLTFEMVDANIAASTRDKKNSDSFSKQDLVRERVSHLMLIPYQVHYGDDGTVYYQWRD